jgi:hypothetical protein
MNHEFVKIAQKNIINAIQSKHVLYTLALSDKKQDVLYNLDALGKLAEMLGERLQKKQIDTNTKENRLYITHPDLEDTSYFSFAPHIMTGYNPFLFYKQFEGENEGQRKGFLVKMNFHSFDFCTKSVNKEANAIYFEEFKSGMPTSLKEAKKLVVDTLKKGNKYNIPIIERITPSIFYIDLEKGIVVSKTSKHDSVAIRAFFSMLGKVAKNIFSDDVGSKRSDKLMETALKETYYPEDYTKWAISEGKASGAYNIPSIVEFYSKDKAEGDAACSFMATHSASAFARDEPDQIAKFNDSIGIFSDNSLGELPSFEKLSAFSHEKQMDFSSLVLVGEVPVSEQIEIFIKQQPEDQDSICENGVMDIGFETSAKKGNICFKPKYGTQNYAMVSRSLLLEYCTDNSVSPENSEAVALKYFGGMLALIHDSASLFIKLYLDANKIKKEFGVDTESEKKAS